MPINKHILTKHPELLSWRALFLTLSKPKRLKSRIDTICCVWASCQNLCTVPFKNALHLVERLLITNDCRWMHDFPAIENMWLFFQLHLQCIYILPESMSFIPGWTTVLLSFFCSILMLLVKLRGVHTGFKVMLEWILDRRSQMLHAWKVSE